MAPTIDLNRKQQAAEAEFGIGVHGSIENNGIECWQRSTLQFVGAGVRRPLSHTHLLPAHGT